MSAYLNTTNATASSNCFIQSSSKAAKIGGTFAYCLILVVSLAGNSLLVIIVYKTKPMRKTINYFIVNMAMSDLLIAVFVLPSQLIELYGGFEVFMVHLGQAFCTVRVFLTYVSCSVSVESLVLIALDRFVAVVFPLRSPLFSSKLCPFVILATWLVSIVFSSPASLAFKPEDYQGETACIRPQEDTFFSYYAATLPIVFCVISLALIVLLYSIILFKLKSHKIPGEHADNTEGRSAKTHRNVLKMVGAIVFGFVLCWGPNSVFWFLYLFVWDNTTRLSCDFIPYYSIVGFLVFANCALRAIRGNYHG